MQQQIVTTFFEHLDNLIQAGNAYGGVFEESERGVKMKVHYKTVGDVSIEVFRQHLPTGFDLLCEAEVVHIRYWARVRCGQDVVLSTGLGNDEVFRAGNMIRDAKAAYDFQKTQELMKLLKQGNTHPF